MEASKAALNEKKEILRAVDTLAMKPGDMKITKLDVNEKSFNVEGFAVDPALFNLYVENVQRKDLFHSVQTEKVQVHGASGYKTCSIKGLLK